MFFVVKINKLAVTRSVLTYLTTAFLIKQKYKKKIICNIFSPYFLFFFDKLLFSCFLSSIYDRVILVYSSGILYICIMCMHN